MSRWVRTGVLTVVVIAALAAGRAITDAMPNDLTGQRAAADPFVVEGKVGSKARLRHADVTVDRVRPAMGIASTTGRLSTPGKFVVVDLSITARHEPLVLTGYQLLASDGRVFTDDGRWVSGTIPAGITWHVTRVFEVPKDALEGAVLEVAKGADWWEQRRDHVLRVDLGLDEQKAAEFAESRDIVHGPTSGFAEPDLEVMGQVPADET